MVPTQSRNTHFTLILVAGTDKWRMRPHCLNGQFVWILTKKSQFDSRHMHIRHFTKSITFQTGAIQPLENICLATQNIKFKIKKVWIIIDVL